MANRATLIGPAKGSWTGTAKLYYLDPPMKWTGWDDVEHTVDRVIVSAAIAPYSGPETYIFPANEVGEITDWGELDGSFKGELNHEKALANAGYEVA